VVIEKKRHYTMALDVTAKKKGIIINYIPMFLIESVVDVKGLLSI
jgi:hypothetical protein